MQEDNYIKNSVRRILLHATIICLFFQQAFSQRAFTLRITAFNIKGDATIIGNRVVQGASTAKDNTATVISNIDGDGDATTTINSSSADLVLPGGSTVAWAGLYWGGRSTNANKNQMKFKKSGGTYTTYTASQLDIGNNIASINGENHYQGFIDVTSYVQAQGAGTYWGGDVRTTVGDGSADTYGTGYYGGWGLIVVYTDATQPYRNITVYDGYNSVWNSTVTVPISGFLTPSSGTFSTKLGVIGWEGDLFLNNDKLRLNVNDDAHNVTNAANPALNFFNSTITNSPRSPSSTNNWGVDFDYITSNIGLPLNSTSTNVYFNTTGDFYLPGALVFAVDINPALLPVELVSFDVKKKNNSVQLEWATASESKNDYYEIQRSKEGLIWDSIGTVDGNGTTPLYHEYNFTDEKAVVFLSQNKYEDSFIYYRLKQVDFNKKFSYSEIKSVKFQLTVFDFSIFPNPGKSWQVISLSAFCNSPVTLKVFTEKGQEILKAQVEEGYTEDIKLRDFESGVYYIEAGNEQHTLRKKLIIE
jgi:hypothetical protein